MPAKIAPRNASAAPTSARERIHVARWAAGASPITARRAKSRAVSLRSCAPLAVARNGASRSVANPIRYSAITRAAAPSAMLQRMNTDANETPTIATTIAAKGARRTVGDRPPRMKVLRRGGRRGVRGVAPLGGGADPGEVPVAPGPGPGRRVDRDRIVPVGHPGVLDAAS